MQTIANSIHKHGEQNLKRATNECMCEFENAGIFVRQNANILHEKESHALCENARTIRGIMDESHIL